MKQDISEISALSPPRQGPSPNVQEMWELGSRFNRRQLPRNVAVALPSAVGRRDPHRRLQDYYSNLRGEEPELASRIICCIYAHKDSVEFNFKNESDQPLSLDIQASEIFVFSKEGQRYRLNKRWYRHGKDFVLAPGQWKNFYCDVLPLPESQVDTYLMTLKTTVPDQSLYLFAMGPKSNFPVQRSSLSERFDWLSQKHNELLARHHARPGKPAVQNFVQGLERVLQYPRAPHVRAALQEVLADMREKGFRLKMDSRLPYVHVHDGSREVCRVVPKKTHFNISVGGGRQFSGLEESYVWHMEIVRYLPRL